ncbi:MAG: PKD domain-containing protein [Microthrixaceae bacterium]
MRSFVMLVVALVIAAAGCGDDDPGSTKVRQPEASPATGEAPLEVSFSTVVDTTSEKQASLVFEWNFDDGSTSSEREPTHVFTAAGTYEVEVTVTDSAGKSNFNTVTVKVTSSSTTSAPQETSDTEAEASLDEWAMGTNEACMEASDSVEQVRATVADPFGSEVVEASVEATHAETAAIESLGIPAERGEEVQTWLDARQDVADYFVQSAQDTEISAEEAAELEQRSLELVPLSNALGLTGCVGDPG